MKETSHPGYGDTLAPCECGDLRQCPGAGAGPTHLPAGPCRGFLQNSLVPSLVVHVQRSRGGNAAVVPTSLDSEPRGVPAPNRQPRRETQRAAVGGPHCAAGGRVLPPSSVLRLSDRVAGPHASTPSCGLAQTQYLKVCIAESTPRLSTGVPRRLPFKQNYPEEPLPVFLRALCSLCHHSLGRAPASFVFLSPAATFGTVSFCRTTGKRLWVSPCP